MNKYAAALSASHLVTLRSDQGGPVSMDGWKYTQSDEAKVFPACLCHYGESLSW